jgi:hypothetical protein
VCLKLQIEEVKNRIHEQHHDTVSLVDDSYIDVITKCNFFDKKYGLWSSQPSRVMAGQRHPQRFKDSLKLTLEECKIRLVNIHKGFVTLDENTFLSAYVKCNFIDKDFGEWSAKPHNVLNGSGHPVRGLIARKNTWMKKYGVDNPFKSDEIQRKVFHNRKNVTRIIHWKTNKELVCTASYEVAFVNWANKNQVDFDWQITHKMPNGKKYRVDAFIKDGEFVNTWIEIKGWLRPDANEKWEWFHKQYPNSQMWNFEYLKRNKILPNKVRKNGKNSDS